MLEIPEAMVLAQQINQALLGREVVNVMVLKTPHKFAWLNGDTEKFCGILVGTQFIKATACGGMVELSFNQIGANKGEKDRKLLFCDGVSLRYYGSMEQKPEKHQLLLELDDMSALTAVIQMYGGIWCFADGELDNPYYKVAKEKPSPLTDKFDKSYFNEMINLPAVKKMSAKAFLATEQRIPGLGNGVLQDILFNCRIHPKRKVNSLSQSEIDSLFDSIKTTLADMTFNGGRDMERDLYGTPGAYMTKVSKNTVDSNCSICGGMIKKENYMGGSIYFCESCQIA